MSAGKPNWSRLHALGKLPKGAEHHIPGLADAAEAEKKLEELKKKLCDKCLKKIFNEEIPKEEPIKEEPIKEEPKKEKSAKEDKKK